jgi:hypothetical protein
LGLAKLCPAFDNLLCVFDDPQQRKEDRQRHEDDLLEFQEDRQCIQTIIFVALKIVKDTKKIFLIAKKIVKATKTIVPAENQLIFR